MLLVIRDETASGSVTNELTLDLLSEQITVRELIRSRVYQEVDDFNRKVREVNADIVSYKGLVKPHETEQLLNNRPSGSFKGKLNLKREIDWKKQYEVACDAFEKNGYFILVDDRQVEQLDEVVQLTRDTRVSFVKLTPLVGG